MTNDEMAVELKKLRRRMARTQAALALSIVAGVVGIGAAFFGIANLRTVVSPEDRSIAVREVRLLYGDERDGARNREQPALTARELLLGDHQGDHIRLQGAGPAPVQVTSANGSLLLTTTTGMNLTLQSADASAELSTAPNHGPHLGFLGPGGQMDMGTSFLALGGSVGTVHLETRDAERHGLRVCGDYVDGQPQDVQRFPPR